MYITSHNKNFINFEFYPKSLSCFCLNYTNHLLDFHPKVVEKSYLIFDEVLVSFF